jgi:hypothetical protein
MKTEMEKYAKKRLPQLRPAGLRPAGKKYIDDFNQRNKKKLSKIKTDKWERAPKRSKSYSNPFEFLLNPTVLERDRRRQKKYREWKA